MTYEQTLRAGHLCPALVWRPAQRWASQRGKEGELGEKKKYDDKDKDTELQRPFVF